MSVALDTWANEAAAALGEIASAHAAVGGCGPGRRYATQEINHAYAVLLSSQFQRFCRDLHTESVVHITAAVTPASLQPVIHARLLESRMLDRGNPNPGNIGSDFGRLGLDFWDAVRQLDQRNRGRQRKLQELAGWRNAIAHQDFRSPNLSPPPPLRLRTVTDWHSACRRLARAFDRAMADHIKSLVGHRPW